MRSSSYIPQLVLELVCQDMEQKDVLLELQGSNI